LLDFPHRIFAEQKGYQEESDKIFQSHSNYYA